MKKFCFISSIISILVFNFIYMASQIAFAEGAGEKIGKSIDQKIESAQEYTQEQKVKIQNDFQNTISQLDNDIKELKLKSKKYKTKVSYNVQKELMEQIEFLEKRKKEIKEDLKSLKNSTGNAWDQMRLGIEQALEKVSDSFKKAKNEFKSGDKDSHDRSTSEKQETSDQKSNPSLKDKADDDKK